jgi:hypothetical protein
MAHDRHHERRHTWQKIGSAILGLLVGGGAATVLKSKPPKPGLPPPPSGNVVVVPAGEYHSFPKPLQPGKSYKAQGKVTIRGGADCLRLVGLNNLTFDGFLFTGAGRAGVFIANGRNIKFLHCESSNNAVQGFLIVDSADITFEDCIANQNRQQHGFYNGQNIDGYTLRRCKASGNGRAGGQINSEEGEHGALRVLIENCVFEGNQRAQGGSELNLMGVGTPASRFIVRNTILRPAGGKRACYAGNFAANRHSFGDLGVVTTGPVTIDSPGVKRL